MWSVCGTGAGAAVQELVGLFGGMMRGLLAEGACQDPSAK